MNTIINQLIAPPPTASSSPEDESSASAAARNGVLGGLSGQLGDFSAVDEIPALSVLLVRWPTLAAFAASLRIRR